MRSHSEQSVEGARIGLFGLLGSGNIGNDASMEAVLGYLQTRHPSAVIDVMCSGPERVTAEYGLAAVQMFWFDRHQDRLSSKPWSLLRVPSRVLDVFRVSRLGAPARSGDRPRCRCSRGEPPAATVEHPVRTLPAHRLLAGCSGRRLPWSASGPVRSSKRATRTLSNWAARLATYRSYRDSGSREAMRRRGLEAGDSVFPDLAFSLPTPGRDRHGGGDWSTIGVGIMAYAGSNDDRNRASDIYRAYVDGMKGIVCRLRRRCPQGPPVHRGHRRVRRRNGARDPHRRSGAAARFGRNVGRRRTGDDLPRDHGVDGAPRSDHCDPVPQSHRCAQTRQADDRHRLLRRSIAT